MPPARPAVAARPVTPRTPRPLARLAATLATPLTLLAAPAPTPFALFVTARARPFFIAALKRLDDLPLALSLNGAAVEIRAGFLDLLRAPFLVERVALLVLALALRAELRGREDVELALRPLLVGPLRPVRFVFVWAICLPPFPDSSSCHFPLTHALSCETTYRDRDERYALR
jgi:hypothetical protein